MHSMADKWAVCESPAAPIPNICHDLCASDGAEASYRNLQSLKHQGQSGKSLTLGQNEKKKKTEGGGGGVRGSECLPRSHTHTQKRSHRSGMLALFTYCNETHLIEANLYGLCKQDFASSCIRCASQQEHIRSPYGTLDIIRTHIFPPPCTFFSLRLSPVLFGLLFIPLRGSFLLFYFRIGMSFIIELSFKCLRFSFFDSRWVSNSLIVICHSLNRNGKS